MILEAKGEPESDAFENFLQESMSVLQEKGLRLADALNADEETFLSFKQRPNWKLAMKVQNYCYDRFERSEIDNLFLRTPLKKTTVCTSRLDQLLVLVF